MLICILQEGGEFFNFNTGGLADFNLDGISRAGIGTKITLVGNELIKFGYGMCWPATEKEPIDEAWFHVEPDLRSYRGGGAERSLSPSQRY